MHATDQPDYWLAFLEKLGKYEIGIGIAMLLVSSALTLSQTFGLDPLPQGVVQLLPLLLFIGGCVVAGTGCAVRKYPAFVTFIHVPVVLWIGLVLIAFA